MAKSNASSNVNQRSITFRQQVEIIKHNYIIGQERRGGKAIPIFIWGMPGIGKSVGVVQAAKELAEKYDREFILNPSPELLHNPTEIVKYFFVIDHRLAQELPVDAKGLVAPHHKFSGKMGWMTPIHIPPVVEGIMGILFYDELPQAPKSVQSAYFQIIHDRVAGEVPIPPGVFQMAAGNPPEALGDYNHPGPALANRFVHYNMHCNFEEWRDWGMEQNNNGETNIDIDLLLFHSFNDGKYLHKFDPTEDESLAFPSPRSWEFVSDLMRGMPREYLFDTITGAVGHAAALQLDTYLRVLRDLPDPKRILEKGEMIHPTDLGKQYALIGAILNTLDNRPDHVKNFVEYLNGLSGELATMAVKLGFKMGKGHYENNPQFRKWLVKNSHLTI